MGDPTGPLSRPQIWAKTDAEIRNLGKENLTFGAWFIRLWNNIFGGSDKREKRSHLYMEIGRVKYHSLLAKTLSHGLKRGVDERVKRVYEHCFGNISRHALKQHGEGTVGEKIEYLVRERNQVVALHEGLHELGGAYRGLESHTHTIHSLQDAIDRVDYEQNKIRWEEISPIVHALRPSFLRGLDSLGLQDTPFQREDLLDQVFVANLIERVNGRVAEVTTEQKEKEDASDEEKIRLGGEIAEAENAYQVAWTEDRKADIRIVQQLKEELEALDRENEEEFPNQAWYDTYNDVFERGDHPCSDRSFRTHLRQSRGNKIDQYVGNLATKFATLHEPRTHLAELHLELAGVEADRADFVGESERLLTLCRQTITSLEVLQNRRDIEIDALFQEYETLAEVFGQGSPSQTVHTLQILLDNPTNLPKIVFGLMDLGEEAQPITREFVRAVDRSIDIQWELRNDFIASFRRILEDPSIGDVGELRTRVDDFCEMYSEQVPLLTEKLREAFTRSQRYDVEGIVDSLKYALESLPQTKEGATWQYLFEEWLPLYTDPFALEVLKEQAGVESYAEFPEALSQIQREYPALFQEIERAIDSLFAQITSASKKISTDVLARALDDLEEIGEERPLFELRSKLSGNLFQKGIVSFVNFFIGGDSRLLSVLTLLERIGLQQVSSEYAHIPLAEALLSEEWTSLYRSERGWLLTSLHESEAIREYILGGDFTQIQETRRLRQEVIDLFRSEEWQRGDESSRMAVMQNIEEAKKIALFQLVSRLDRSDLCTEEERMLQIWMSVRPHIFADDEVVVSVSRRNRRQEFIDRIITNQATPYIKEEEEVEALLASPSFQTITRAFANPRSRSKIFTCMCSEDYRELMLQTLGESLPEKISQNRALIWPAMRALETIQRGTLGQGIAMNLLYKNLMSLVSEQLPMGVRNWMAEHPRETKKLFKTLLSEFIHSLDIRQTERMVETLRQFAEGSQTEKQAIKKVVAWLQRHLLPLEEDVTSGKFGERLSTFLNAMQAAKGASGGA